jgi:hypothetical protein
VCAVNRKRPKSKGKKQKTKEAHVPAGEVLLYICCCFFFFCCLCFPCMRVSLLFCYLLSLLLFLCRFARG